jgi:hypothetical protein
MSQDQALSYVDKAIPSIQPAYDSSKKVVAVDAVPVLDDAASNDERSVHVPTRIKLTAVLLVTLIGFGSHWSSGVTGAMKSTLKKV